jgi:hypothetical protein
MAGMSEQPGAAPVPAWPPTYRTMVDIPAGLLTREAWACKWRVIEYGTLPSAYLLTELHTPAGRSVRRTPLYREADTKAVPPKR